MLSKYSRFSTFLLTTPSHQKKVPISNISLLKTTVKIGDCWFLFATEGVVGHTHTYKETHYCKTNTKIRLESKIIIIY